MSKKGKHFCPECKKKNVISEMRREEERHAIVVYSFKKYVCPKCGHSIGRVN